MKTRISWWKNNEIKKDKIFRPKRNVLLTLFDLFSLSSFFPYISVNTNDMNSIFGTFPNLYLGKVWSKISFLSLLIFGIKSFFYISIVLKESKNILVILSFCHKFYADFKNISIF